MEVEISAELLNSVTDESGDEELKFSEVSDITYSEFFEQFLMKNRPCLIKGLSDNWKASELWVTNCMPNFNYLKSKYERASVTVHSCDDKNEKTSYKFSDFIEYWEDYIKDDRCKPIRYLKDWHLKNEFPEDYFYEVPLYFASDWLNEYLVEVDKDDYRFVYMGVRQSWTAFHVDVMTSYSWSVNICGRKKWILFPPNEEKYLCDNFGNFPTDITALYKNLKHFEVFQNPGDAIFVPSNWYHQVWNIQDTISINHNWINGCNLKNVWLLLEKNLDDVKNEIKDCEDMENFSSHCQVMLKATWNGMNFIDFYKFLSHISSKRINMLRNGRPIVLSRNKLLGKNHALFDLRAIYDTLVLLIRHEDISKLKDFENVKPPPIDLLNDIKRIIEL